MTARGFATCVRLTTGVAIALLLFTPAHAQDISINFGQGTGLTERVIQLIALLTVLSLAPSILVMMTSFTRIVVVLSLLRTALGTATAPPNAVIVSLALFLTAFEKAADHLQLEQQASAITAVPFVVSAFHGKTDTSGKHHHACSDGDAIKRQQIHA